MNNRERIGDINNFELPRPVVSLELFFDGNDDWGSIGYNLPDQIAPQQFHAILQSIRDRNEVADVLIEVKDLEDPDRHTFHVWQRELALVESFAVQASLASFRAVS